MRPSLLALAPVLCLFATTALHAELPPPEVSPRPAIRSPLAAPSNPVDVKNYETGQRMRPTGIGLLVYLVPGAILWGSGQSRMDRYRPTTYHAAQELRAEGPVSGCSP